MAKKFFATPIYYANGNAHLGHFLTTTVSDVLSRYWRNILGDENVFFTTGLDEHGTTVEQAAEKEGYKLSDFQKYVDRKATEWKEAFDITNISYDYFVRTTNKEHEKHSQDFIRKMAKAGDVYKDTYIGKYCNGCEKFLTLSDLDERGLCPIHRPDQVEEVEEKNYFFKLSKYSKQVAKLIEDGEIKIIPANKRKEILSRLKEGVEDVSISRPKEKVAWGVEFPDDPKQTVYVWVEALINYRSSLQINSKEGFAENTVHILGKDINWFHNVIWPSMLLSAGEPLYKESFVHSFLKIGGSKISKSLGNTISPQELTEKYGVDGARYLILSSLPYKNDSDVTWDYLDDKYTADLANGIGNLVSRVAAMAKKNSSELQTNKYSISKEVSEKIDNYKLDEALEIIWKLIKESDVFVNENEVWKLTGKERDKAIQKLINNIRQIATDLKAFLPETSEKIEEQFKGPKIKSAEPLFPRLN